MSIFDFIFLFITDRTAFLPTLFKDYFFVELLSSKLRGTTRPPLSPPILNKAES